MGGLSAAGFGVLVADDDLRSRDSVAALLTLEGFRTQEVECGNVALEFLRRQLESATDAEASERGSREHGRERREGAAGRAPRTLERIHFLVLDYNMPDLTGLEVLRRLRVELGLFLPAILMSGESNEELERAVLEAGGFALVPKPVVPVHFRRLVWKLVRRHLES
ncbi:MAG: response regulator [Planctomycetes bacterium]|nr:response regulator [Planctomycetota bacterium]